MPKQSSGSAYRNEPRLARKLHLSGQFVAYDVTFFDNRTDRLTHALIGAESQRLPWLWAKHRIRPTCFPPLTEMMVSTIWLRARMREEVPSVSRKLGDAPITERKAVTSRSLVRPTPPTSRSSASHFGVS